MKTRNPIPPLSNGMRYFTNDAGQRICAGAQMGRSNTLPVDRQVAPRLRLYRLRFVDGCYDQGGAYWGAPATVYRALGDNPSPVDASDETIEIFVRGDDRDEAKQAVRRILPNALFYR